MREADEGALVVTDERSGVHRNRYGALSEGDVKVAVKLGVFMMNSTSWTSFGCHLRVMNSTS